MTDSDSELATAYDEAYDAAERAYAEGDGDSLSEEAEEELRDPTERLADALSEASLSELLEVAGFEDAPDDVSAVDLPAVIADADPNAIVELRTLLQLADLGESWSDLSAEDRADRVDRVVVDAETADSDGGFALTEYIDRLDHILGDEEASGGGGSAESDADGEAADVDAADAGGADADAEDDSAAEDAVEAVVCAAADAMADDGDEASADDESEDAEKDTAETVVDAAAEAVSEDGEDADDDGDDELLELEDHVDRLRELVGDDEETEPDAAEDAEAETDADEEAAEADAVEDDDTDEDDGTDRTTDDQSRSTSGSRGRLSTVPSSRSDMGKSSRFSTARGKQ